jgi:hypothetical protein
MTQDTCSPSIVGSALPGADPGTDPGTNPAASLTALAELPPLRCADAARMRGEPLQASAVRYRRFLLLEVPRPWGSSALDGKHLDAGVARQLAAAAAAADTHVVLIRRPGRHPAAASAGQQRALAWAFADVSGGAERVLWGAWREPADLLSLDLTADIPGEANAAGAQRLVLVCTNGKRDQCCAIRGRPVAAAVAADTDWDTWECSHLGGHRFAATVMLLPTGDMFGWLDPESAVEVMRRFDAGQLTASHYRGRAGQPFPVQAALHAGAVRLGDFRRDAIHVSAVNPVQAGLGTRWPGHSAADGDLWEVEIVHRTQHSPGTAYRMIMAGSPLAPTFLSCSDSNPKAETRYAALSFSRI